MNKIITAIALFVVSSFAFAGPNVIMKSWDWKQSNGSFTQTVDEGGFSAGSKIIVGFTAEFAGRGHVSVSEYPATGDSFNGVGCARITSVSTTPGDFDPKTAVLVRQGYNQGIDYVAPASAALKRTDKRSGRVTYVEAPLELGKKYYLNTTSVGTGCGDIRWQATIFAK